MYSSTYRSAFPKMKISTLRHLHKANDVRASTEKESSFSFQFSCQRLVTTTLITHFGVVGINPTTFLGFGVSSFQSRPGGSRGMVRTVIYGIVRGNERPLKSRANVGAQPSGAGATTLRKIAFNTNSKFVSRHKESEAQRRHHHPSPSSSSSPLSSSSSS